MTFNVSKATELDKTRQQFDDEPYPNLSLEQSPRDDYQTLYQHNFVTPYYLRHRTVVQPQENLILDVGCGSGCTSLMLAEANPGTKIVGIDLSEASIQLARQRLAYHGFEDAEFHVLAIEELPKLGIKFDYINCDEVLYLLNDPAAGLQTMKSVLKPDGLIRANLHSIYQRTNYYRAQTLFKFMGLMNESPKAFEREVVAETMDALQEFVKLKSQIWTEEYRNPQSPELLKEMLAVNFLLVGDRGFTIPDLFALLDQAELEFVSMVNWRHWDIAELFKDAEMPAFWDMSLTDASAQEKLHLFELLHPIHRLLDFWCAHPGEAGVAVDDWHTTDWQTVMVHLHPQLRNDVLREELLRCIRTGEAFEISRDVRLPTLAPIFIEPDRAACLLPLWEGTQPIQALVERYRQGWAIDPETQKPVSEATAFATVKNLLDQLDAFLYVLLER